MKPLVSMTWLDATRREFALTTSMQKYRGVWTSPHECALTTIGERDWQGTMSWNANDGVITMRLGIMEGGLPPSQTLEIRPKLAGYEMDVCAGSVFRWSITLHQTIHLFKIGEDPDNHPFIRGICRISSKNEIGRISDDQQNQNEHFGPALLAATHLFCDNMDEFLNTRLTYPHFMHWHNLRNGLFVLKLPRRKSGNTVEYTNYFGKWPANEAIRELHLYFDEELQKIIGTVTVGERKVELRFADQLGQITLRPDARRRDWLEIVPSIQNSLDKTILIPVHNGWAVSDAKSRRDWLCVPQDSGLSDCAGYFVGSRPYTEYAGLIVAMARIFDKQLRNILVRADTDQEDATKKGDIFVEFWPGLFQDVTL
ncbi:hypothetical protein C8R43DRAFT_1238342 [Mycena crocata]|nr:hypothetical protein C8R43DRAFT_1238342 [Mycena crocata]